MRILQACELSIKPGDTFNWWTVVGIPFRSEGKHPRWMCQCRCQCGTEKLVNVPHLKQGRSRNCGCLRKTTLPASVRKHGKTKSKLYRVWKGMRERCSYEKHTARHNYGGRGIRVCDEWQTDYQAFERWALAHGWAPGLEIDRKDTDGDYTPDNCRFVTTQENCNNKRNNVLLTVWGETKTIRDWSVDDRCVVTYQQLRGRIKQKWDAQEAITTPCQKVVCPLVTAFGETKSVEEWAADPRCVVQVNCLRMRLFWYSWDAERAITSPNMRG